MSEPRILESLIWIVPAVVALLGIWRPRAGVLALVAALPLFGSPPGGPYLAALDVAAMVVIACSWRVGPAPVSRLNPPVAAFIAVSLVSLLPLAYRLPSFDLAVLTGVLSHFPEVETWSNLYSWRAAANLVLGGGIYLAVRRTFAGRSLRPLALALAGGLFAALTIGLLEQAGFLKLGLWRPIGGELFATRLHSLFFHSGWFAEFIVLSTPIAGVGLLMGGRLSRRAGITLLALAAVALLFTEQRGGWIAGFVQVLTAAVLFGPSLVRQKGRRTGLVVLVILVATVFVAIVSIQPETIGPLRDRMEDAVSDLSGRGAVWKASLLLTAERPLLGWGLGAFKPIWAKTDFDFPIRKKHVWLTPHNHLLMLLVERGVLGLACFLLTALSAGWILFHARRSSRSQESQLALGLGLSFLGFLVFGMVQYLFFLKSLEWLCWMLLAMVSLLDGKATGRRTHVVALLLAFGALLLIPWRATRLEPPRNRSDRSFGFHAVEESGSGRWQWTLARAARRIPWEDRVLVVPLVNGHPKGDRHPVHVTVRVDGEKLFEGAVGASWHEYRLDLGPPTGNWVLLMIEAEPAFRPFQETWLDPELEPSRDIRLLGVALGQVRWDSSP